MATTKTTTSTETPARKPAAKAAPTPKRAHSRTKNPDRPKRPEFAVIEDNLHYSPDGEREIVVTIDPEWGLVEPILTEAEENEAQQSDTVVKILKILYGEDGAQARIRGLKTSQFFKFVYRWMDEFTKHMGAESAGE